MAAEKNEGAQLSFEEEVVLLGPKLNRLRLFYLAGIRLIGTDDGSTFAYETNGKHWQVDGNLPNEGETYAVFSFGTRIKDLDPFAFIKFPHLKTEFDSLAAAGYIEAQLTDYFGMYIVDTDALFRTDVNPEEPLTPA